MTIRFYIFLLCMFTLVGCDSKQSDSATNPTNSPNERIQQENEFAVSASQLQALGIKLLKLDKPTEIQGLTYPALIVVPPQSEQVLSAPVAGMVDQILIAEHQNVRIGDALVRLNSPEFGQLQLALMEAANSDRMARQTLERERELYKDGIVAQRRVYEAELAAKDSLARLRQSQAALRLAGLDAGSINRVVNGGVLMDGLTLRAKQAGTILAIEVKPGQRVESADPLLRIANLTELWLDIQIPADRSNAWSKDQNIIIMGSKLTAKPISVSSLVSESQTVTLRAKVNAGEVEFSPGAFVQAQVPFANTEGTWALPIAAVVRQNGNAFVFVRNANGFTALPVQVVASAAQLVSVEGNLKAGDEIGVTNVIALKAAWLGESGGE